MVELMNVERRVGTPKGGERTVDVENYTTETEGSIGMGNEEEPFLFDGSKTLQMGGADRKKRHGQARTE